jgi:RNA polymerase sigma factor (sigma-70 family)
MVCRQTVLGREGISHRNRRGNRGIVCVAPNSWSADYNQFTPNQCFRFRISTVAELLLMNQASNTETSLSLLKQLKLQPADDKAWREFVERYGEKILNWCRYWGLQEADAADVTQTVLLKLAKDIGKFDKQGGSFRAWLKTVSHHAWYDLVTRHEHKFAKGGEEFERKLQSEESRDELAEQLEAAWDQELIQLASDRVRLRVHPKTWRAFELTAIENLPGKDVADQLEMNLPAVYQARSNVLKLLKEEARNLEQTEFA